MAESDDYFLREVQSEISNTVRRNQRRIAKYNQAVEDAASSVNISSSGVPKSISPSDWDWDESVTSRQSYSSPPPTIESGDFGGLSDLRPTTATGSSRVRAHQFIPQKDDWGEITNPMDMYGDLYIRFQRAAKTGVTAGKDLYYFGEMTLGEYVQFKNSSSLGKAINELGDDYTWDIRNTPPDLLI